jgi:hypothetical protein
VMSGLSIADAVLFVATADQKRPNRVVSVQLSRSRLDFKRQGDGDGRLPLSTGRLTRQCQVSQGFALRCRAPPMLKSALRRPTPPSIQERRDADDSSSRVADPQTLSFITSHRIEHLNLASKGVRHPDVGNLKQYSVLVRSTFQGRSDLATYPESESFDSDVGTTKPFSASLSAPLRVGRRMKNLEVFSTRIAFVSER